jgi:uncharacterized protein YceK
MRRFMLPFFVLIALGGCSDEQTPSASASSAPARSPAAAQAKGDDKTACATAKSARTAILNDVLLASMTITDADSSAAEVTEAAETLKASFTKLGNDMGKAADQAATDKLREALRAYADGAKTVVSNVQAAGTDRSKLEGVTEVTAMDTAEKTVLQLCP